VGFGVFARSEEEDVNEKNNEHHGRKSSRLDSGASSAAWSASGGGKNLAEGMFGGVGMAQRQILSMEFCANATKSVYRQQCYMSNKTTMHNIWQEKSG